MQKVEHITTEILSYHIYFYFDFNFYLSGNLTTWNSDIDNWSKIDSNGPSMLPCGASISLTMEKYWYTETIFKKEEQNWLFTEVSLWHYIFLKNAHFEHGLFSQTTLSLKLLLGYVSTLLNKISNQDYPAQPFYGLKNSLITPLILRHITF